MRKNLSNKKMVGRGFTLIELLFAFMFLAWGFARLLEGQSNSIRSVRESQKIIVASELARAKMLDCKNEVIKKGLAAATDYSEDGDFDDDAFKEFTWECHGVRIDVPSPNLDILSRAAGPGEKSGALSTILGPIFSLLATTLGDSARELTTIVRWKFDGEDQELKLTTHIIDTKIFSAAMSAVSGSVNPNQKPNQNPNTNPLNPRNNLGGDRN